MSLISSSRSQISQIPSKCDCGLDVKILTSKSKDNPGRPFFRCVSQKENHLFKWVEDAVYDEVRVTMPKVEAMEVELEVLKTRMDDVTKEHHERQIEIQELNKKTKWLMIVFSIFVVVVVVLLVRYCVEGKIMFVSNM